MLKDGPARWQRQTEPVEPLGEPGAGTCVAPSRGCRSAAQQPKPPGLAAEQRKGTCLSRRCTDPNGQLRREKNPAQGDDLLPHSLPISRVTRIKFCGPCRSVLVGFGKVRTHHPHRGGVCWIASVFFSAECRYRRLGSINETCNCNQYVIGVFRAPSLFLVFFPLPRASRSAFGSRSIWNHSELEKLSDLLKLPHLFLSVCSVASCSAKGKGAVAPKRSTAERRDRSAFDRLSGLR